MKCKISGNEIKPFMSFGEMPIANGFLKKKEFQKEFFFKMEVGFSEKFSLFQLNDHPVPEQMFNNNYPFYTGSSELMKLHFKKYSSFLKKNYIKYNSKIIEIGSNDGTFLKNFIKNEIDYIGFEPSGNVAKLAKKNGIKTINKFFGTKSLSSVKNFLGQTDVIFAANVICHIPNLLDLINAVDKLLSKNGVFIFEEPYLGSMFGKTSYDQIYDEHIFMFSATSVKKIFSLFDMELIDLIKQETHGGSMRYVISRKKNRSINSNVKRILAEEKKLNLDNVESCLLFKKKCEESKIKLQNSLKNFKLKGKKIVGYAATSKSTTILNYCKIGPQIIDYICDTTPEKIGKYSPGMHIPIVSTDYFRKDNPDIAYLFAWNHKKEILKKEKCFKKNNLKWISHVEI
jgi:methylation protein EvaC